MRKNLKRPPNRSEVSIKERFVFSGSMRCMVMKVRFLLGGFTQGHKMAI